MIESLRLKNFKCFQELSLPLAPLTLLSGINGTGKSTVIQALLLLRQSWQESEAISTVPAWRINRLTLNGDLVQIGTAKDALYAYAEKEGAEKERIEFELRFTDGIEEKWCFTWDREDADVLRPPSLPGPMGATDQHLFSSGLLGHNFQYLAAERIGPRTSFAMSRHGVRHRRQLGARGEFTAHFLETFGRAPIEIEELTHPDAATKELRSQLEAWMDFISPGTRLKMTSHSGMDLVQLEYQFVAGRDVTDPFRPTNVGFGLTYTLPILVAALAAGPQSLLLIENPEAHLHPRGQARMGEFLARAASGGAQVIVETHSDHVLNGIRLAVHDGLLAPDKVALHFFTREDAENRPIYRTISPRMDRHGRIDRRPDGFFDEWDRSLSRLLTPAKGA